MKWAFIPWESSFLKVFIVRMCLQHSFYHSSPVEDIEDNNGYILMNTISLTKEWINKR